MNLNGFWDFGFVGELEEYKSIEQISFLVGYRDKKHFYKLFKKATGVTPNTLRETRTPPEAVHLQPTEDD